MGMGMGMGMEMEMERDGHGHGHGHGTAGSFMDHINLILGWAKGDGQWHRGPKAYNSQYLGPSPSRGRLGTVVSL